MDGARFDGIMRTTATGSGDRRALVRGLLVTLIAGAVAAPWALEAAAAGNCRKGQRPCHGKCCPRRAPVCCRKGCCRKGYRCCQGGTKCCAK